MPGKHIPRPTRLLSYRTLRNAWDDARRQGKKFSTPGIDGITGRQFEQRLEVNIREICSQIKGGTFTFSPLRGCWVHKKHNPSKLRLICIPTVRDRLVQRAISQVLSVGDRFSVVTDVNFGFIAGRGVHAAITQATELRQEHRWVLKTDISAFFDRIQRDRLRGELARGAPKSLIPLLEQVIGLEVLAKSKSERERIAERGITKGLGLRQGMPLSPLLSNVELRAFDRHVIKRGYRMVRYADDLAFFFDSAAELRSAETEIRFWLEELGHTIPGLREAGKTAIYPPDDPLEFLGMDLAFDRVAGRYVPKVPESTKKKILTEIREVSTLARCQAENWSLKDYLQSISSKLGGYATVYKYASNHGELLASINAVRHESMKKLLAEVFGVEAIRNLNDAKLRFLGLERIAE